MVPLNLPSFDIKIAQNNGRTVLFDILRRKYVALTPEEWVRQNFVHYLIQEKHFPSTLLANEVQLKIGEKRLRADTVLYDRELSPKVIIEYKAPHISITREVFDQISTYNMLLQVDYLIVSNGMAHYCCQMDYENKQYRFLENIPDYTQL